MPRQTNLATGYPETLPEQLSPSGYLKNSVVCMTVSQDLIQQWWNIDGHKVLILLSGDDREEYNTFLPLNQVRV